MAIQENIKAIREATVPEPTLRRLPLYHRVLKDIQAKGNERVSCTDLAAELNLDPTQIRKDLEFTGVVGRPRIGYQLPELIEGIELFLGWNNTHEAFLVGAGHLGAALMGYKRFSDYGMDIVAAFDTDASKVGRQIHGKQILPLSKLPNLARRMHILMGIITVPDSAAQEVAELMVAGGIIAIWNFAPMQLHLPEGVIVHNENLYCSLASLSQKLAMTLRARKTRG